MFFEDARSLLFLGSFCLVLWMTIHKMVALLPNALPKAHSYQIIRWFDFQKVCKTGDLLLFVGGEKTSEIVRIWSNSPFTHVGFALKNKRNEVLIWHSDPSDQRVDLVNFECHEGVQVNDLRAYLSTYKGLLYWKPLDLTSEQRKKIASLVPEERCYKFNKNNMDLLRSVQGFSSFPLPPKESTVDTYFCSEFVAQVLIKANVIPLHFLPNQYHPEHFTRNMNEDPILSQLGLPLHQPLYLVLP